MYHFIKNMDFLLWKMVQRFKSVITRMYNKFPFDFFKKSKYNKLNYDSAVQCEDIRSVSKARMGKYICKIDGIDMVEIKIE